MKNTAPGETEAAAMDGRKRQPICQEDEDGGESQLSSSGRSRRHQTGLCDIRVAEWTPALLLKQTNEGFGVSELTFKYSVCVHTRLSPPPAAAFSRFPASITFINESPKHV